MFWWKAVGYCLKITTNLKVSNYQLWHLLKPPVFVWLMKNIDANIIEIMLILKKYLIWKFKMKKKSKIGIPKKLIE